MQLKNDKLYQSTGKIGDWWHVEMQIDIGCLRTIILRELLENVSAKQKMLQMTTANEEVMEYSLSNIELNYQTKEV